MPDTKHISSYCRGMNKLPLEKRVQILNMMVEGSSMRAISRVADVSINTVTKLLVDAGLACARFHDEVVRGVNAQQIQIKSLEVYSSDDRLALPVITPETKLIIEFDVKSEFEPSLNIVFRFCDKGWTPTQNIFLLNQNRNSFFLFNFDRLPVTVEEADYHFKGSFPDKDGFIELPFSGKWKFYITDSQDTSLVYVEGRFFVVDNNVSLHPALKRDELEGKTFWPVELAKVFNIKTDFLLPEDFYPTYVARLEIIQNRNIYYPFVIERNANT